MLQWLKSPGEQCHAEWKRRDRDHPRYIEQVGMYPKIDRKVVDQSNVPDMRDGYTAEGNPIESEIYPRGFGFSENALWLNMDMRGK